MKSSTVATSKRTTRPMNKLLLELRRIRTQGVTQFEKFTRQRIDGCELCVTIEMFPVGKRQPSTNRRHRRRSSTPAEAPGS